jgi:hypothetical protein
VKGQFIEPYTGIQNSTGTTVVTAMDPETGEPNLDAYDSFVRSLGFTPLVAARGHSLNAAMRSSERRFDRTFQAKTDTIAQLMFTHWLNEKNGEDNSALETKIEDKIDNMMELNKSLPKFERRNVSSLKSSIKNKLKNKLLGLKGGNFSSKTLAKFFG